MQENINNEKIEDVKLDNADFNALTADFTQTYEFEESKLKGKFLEFDVEEIEDITKNYEPFSNVEGGAEIAKSLVNGLKKLIKGGKEKGLSDIAEFIDFVEDAKNKLENLGIPPLEIDKIEKNPDYDFNKMLDHKIEVAKFNNDHPYDIYENSLEDKFGADEFYKDANEKERALPLQQQLFYLFKLRDGIGDGNIKAEVERYYFTMRNDTLPYYLRRPAYNNLTQEFYDKAYKNINETLGINTEEQLSHNEYLEKLKKYNPAKEQKELIEQQNALFEQNKPEEAFELENNFVRYPVRREKISDQELNNLVNQNKRPLLNNFIATYKANFGDQEQTLTKENTPNILDQYYKLSKIHEARPKPYFFQIYSLIRNAMEESFLKKMEEKLLTVFKKDELAKMDQFNSEKICNDSVGFNELPKDMAQLAERKATAEQLAKESKALHDKGLNVDSQSMLEGQEIKDDILDDPNEIRDLEQEQIRANNKIHNKKEELNNDEIIDLEEDKYSVVEDAENIANEISDDLEKEKYNEDIKNEFKPFEMNKVTTKNKKGKIVETGEMELEFENIKIDDAHMDALLSETKELSLTERLQKDTNSFIAPKDSKNTDAVKKENVKSLNNNINIDMKNKK